MIGALLILAEIPEMSGTPGPRFGSFTDSIAIFLAWPKDGTNLHPHLKAWGPGL